MKWARDRIVQIRRIWKNTTINYSASILSLIRMSSLSEHEIIVRDTSQVHIVTWVQARWWQSLCRSRLIKTSLADKWVVYTHLLSWYCDDIKEKLISPDITLQQCEQCLCQLCKYKQTKGLRKKQEKHTWFSFSWSHIFQCIWG